MFTHLYNCGQALEIIVQLPLPKYYTFCIHPIIEFHLSVFTMQIENRMPYFYVVSGNEMEITSHF